jgi:hypothetical protein
MAAMTLYAQQRRNATITIWRSCDIEVLTTLARILQGYVERCGDGYWENMQRFVIGCLDKAEKAPRRSSEVH